MRLFFASTSRRLIWFFVLMSSIAFMSGCDSRVIWQDDTYAVIWIDTDDTAMLAYKLEGGSYSERVEKRVVAAGSDSSYVVIARVAPDVPNVRMYYYLDKSKDSANADPSASLTGPMTKQAFEAFANKLNLPPLTEL